MACVLAMGLLAGAQVEALPFLDDSAVQQINLTVAPDDWATLLQNYEADTYYHATFNWNGLAVSAGIRQHGGGSRSPVKPNVDVNFGHYTKNQTFLGLPFILLKANNEDPSNLREWLSMKLFRMMGFPAPREAPAQVSINGQYFGFYMIVEHEDETFLERNFGESGGYLYEFEQSGTFNFNNLGTDPSEYAPLLKLKTNQDTPDLQTFCNLVQVINQPSGPGFTDADFITALSQYIDPKSFLSYAATENVLAESDGMVGGVVGVNNIYLYQFQGTTFYQLIPWDKDFTFSTWDRDIMTGFTLPPNINILAQRLIGIPEYRNHYLAQVAKAVDLLGRSGGWADNAVTTEYGIINAAASNDPNKQCGTSEGLGPCGAVEFQKDVQWLHTYLAARAPFVEPELVSDGYQPVLSGPVISTVSVVGQAARQAAPIAPGALVDLSGANLGGSGQSSGAPLPRSLGSTFVAVEGVRAPLVMTSAGQIEAQIPGDLPATSASIVVSVGGDMSNTFSATVQAAAPSILAVTHAATGLAVSADNPLTPGEVVTAYMIGLGAVTADLAIGAAAPRDSLIGTAATPQVVLGGTALDVLFSGLAPGYVGLYQVNIAVPQVLPPVPSANLTVTCGGQSASAALAIANQ